MNKPSLFELSALSRVMPTPAASSVQPGNKLVRRKPSPLALEQRFMFDGAAVGDAVQMLTSPSVDASAPTADGADAAVGVSGLVDASVDSASPVAVAESEAQRLVAELFLATVPDSVLAESMAAASSAVRQFVESASDETLFALFGGGQSQPDAAWLARAADLRAAVGDGTLQLSIVQADGFDRALAIAAFAPEGPGGGPTLFVTRNGFDQLDAPDATRVLAEEFGHAIDYYLNAGSDSAGDEGERFAAAVLGLSASETAITDDHGSALVGGSTYAVEYAAYDFVNAYAMVYDLDNSGATVGSAGETDAAKEQNSHNFNIAALGAVNVDDYNYNSKYFSGNDVNAIGLNIGGQTYYGWISRPIKSGGVVRGFYFWTDNSFTNLQLAQADGNQDGDSSTADNKGFLLVVDQAWFTQQIATSTSYTINNAKDGNLGAISVDNIGSSSDRVDSALNALVDSNVAPTATNDTVSGAPSSTLSTGQGNAALEQGYNTNTTSEITATIIGSGKVLSNDTDSNGDPLSVTTVTSRSTGTLTTATSAGASLVGKYGTLTIKSDGNWTYTPDNTNPTVNALLTGSLSEAFSYTVSDGKGGTASATLTVQINGSNDAPVASNDYNVAKEITTISNTGFTATGNVVTNDSDVDSGDTKVITGIQIDGAATVGTVTANSGSASLSFTGDSGFTSVSSAQELYVSVGGIYRAVYTSDGVTQVAVSTKLESPSGSNNWVITLSGTPSFYYDVGGNQTISNVASFFSTNTAVLFENSTNTTENTSGGKTATVAVAQTTGFTTLTNLSGLSGTLAVGMTVTGTGITQTTKVSEITYTGGVLTSVKLDQVLTGTTSGSYSFSGNGTLSQALQGAHGTLTLASSGAYTYTPTTDNPNLSSGQSAIEVFDYMMQDTAGVTSAAKLYITVYGSGTNDTAVVNDTGTAYESGVGRNGGNTLTNDNTAYSGANASGNVLLNDGSTNTPVVSLFTKADGTSSTAAGATMTASYGTLNITSGGAFTYVIDNTNSAVDTLLPGSTLTETFIYKVTNSVSGISFAQLVITITGTNDRPVAMADTGAVQEDGTLLASGNVLANDTDVDSGDTKVVSQAGTSSAGTVVAVSTTSANGLSITGTYGTLVLGADGTYRYTLNNNAANVQALAQGATADDVFTYEVKDTNSATRTSTLTITVTGANEAPINQFGGTAISSIATTSVTTAVNTAIDFIGSKLLSVADSDTNLTSIILAVEKGTLSFTPVPSGVTLSANSGTNIKISAGTQAELNAALALLRYTPGNNVYGTDFLTIMSLDGANAFDSDGIAINIPTNTTATVSEPALGAGSNAASTAETATGGLTLATGQSVVAQQNGSIYDGANNVIGTWQVNTNGTFSVSLTAASSATSTSFNYVVNDSFGNAVNNTVTVSITDDGPTAFANIKSVNEGSTATGNVLSDGTADTFGADGAKTTTPTGGVVGVRAAGGDTATAVVTGTASAMTGLYGTLTLNADGSYSYVANSNSVSSAQDDVFVYTIEDADGTRSTATLTITVNVVVVDTAFSVNDVSISEGGLMTFTVTRTGASAVSQSIDFATSAGTAGSGSDFTAASGTLTFAAGVTSQTFTVQSTADATYEGGETFSVTLSNNSAGSTISDASGTGTILDDGTGPGPYGPNPLVGPDDDRVSEPTSPSIPVDPPAQTPAPVIVPDTPVAPVVSFNSAIVVTTTSPVAANLERTAEPIADIRTSASGFQVVVAEAPEPNLSLFRGITDQFIEPNKPTTFALPADAFVHTKADATVTITAKLADGRDLPEWVEFDARSGTFQLNPPAGFNEELQIKVLARDGEGREATAIFKLTVGEGKPKPLGRMGLSEQIMAAAKRSSPWLDALRPQGVKAAPDKLPVDRLQAAPAAVRQPARVG